MTLVTRAGFLAAALVLAVSACGSTPPVAVPASPDPPTAKLKPQSAIGDGEGQLNLIAWVGYTDDAWVKPFVDQTGCKVTVKYAASSSEMLAWMKDGGAGQVDMVSASGDAGLALIYNGDVRPMNPALIPDWNNFHPYFKSPPYNTVNDVHYGVSLQWGPNTLVFSTKKFPNAPTSWSVLYDVANKGAITVPDSPMQIADAALYLSTTQPTLGIKDPYELTQKQFDAAIALLKKQRTLLKQYFVLPTDEMSLFQNGQVFAGAGSTYQTVQLRNAGVADTVPAEGATAWGDTWMLATKAPHPNCAYRWAKYVSTPKVQAQQAISYGETPVNTKACAEMEAMLSGSCGQYHADAAANYFDKLKFWKTPLATCPDGKTNCIPYDQWVTGWAAVKA
jgi:putative spermidine/putrescine transport system substrate-binding protein